MRCGRNYLKVLPLALVIVVIFGILFQESFLLSRTEVHQETVYKFSALEQKQLDANFQLLRSPNAVDKAILSQLLQKQDAAKKTPQKGMDKTRSWFQRENPEASKIPLEEHPLFPGFVLENSDLCGDSAVDILIYVHSAVENYDRRRFIRSTWASTKLFHDISIKTVFILGKPALDPEQVDVLNEYAAHGDLVQGNFLDTFRNLTMKAITILMWTNWHCPQAKYLVKADDDYFVDTFQVTEDFIPVLAQKTRTLECRYAEKYEIIRKQDLKWHIELDVLKSRKYWPPFCSGFFVIYTGDLIRPLYDNSFHVTEYVSVDDAYLFGLLTENTANVTFLNIHDKLSLNTRPKPLEEIANSQKFEFSVFEVEIPESMESLWKIRMRRLSEWGRAHSLYIKLFETGSKSKTVIVK